MFYEIQMTSSEAMASSFTQAEKAGMVLEGMYIQAEDEEEALAMIVDRLHHLGCLVLDGEPIDGHVTVLSTFISYFVQEAK